METEKHGMVLYSEEYLPSVFKLENNGVLCYLNSLIQALMSCTSMNQKIKNIRVGLCDIYRIIYKKIGEKKCHIGDDVNIKTGNVSFILAHLCARYKSRSDSLCIGRQEDAHESFIFLIESMGNNIEKLFHVRYETYIYCTICKKKKKSGNNQPELYIDLSGISFENKSEMENCIERSINAPESYKCEYCSAVNNPLDNGKYESNILQICNLVRLSEILVILLRKQSSEIVKYFSDILNFKSKYGLMEYKLVAQIDHIGTSDSGHYVARCLRRKPNGMHDIRGSKIKNSIKNLKEKKKICTEEEKVIIDKNISKYKEMLVQNENSDPVGVFLLNDSDVKYCSEGFIPNKETQIIIYHINSITS
jgi:ubiquitin C-terminal hydrolase